MAKILNNSQFYNKVRTDDKLVVIDFFLQHGVDHVKC